MSSSSPKTRFVLGVDGGGTKTSAWIATVSEPVPSVQTARPSRSASIREIIGRGESGPGNPKPIGFEAACENISTAIHEALQKAGLKGGVGQIDATCFGLAGIGSTEEKTTIESWIGTQDFRSPWRLTDDIDPILWAAKAEWEMQENRARTQEESTESDPDLPALYVAPNPSPWSNSVTLIAGTGSVVRAYDSSGNSARAGGWGYLLGDEGSGYSTGLAALQHICDSFDRGRAFTPWEQEILSSLQITTGRQLITWIYQLPTPRREIAEFAQIVFNHRQGNGSAQRISDIAVDAWCHLVSIISKKMKLYDDFGLAVAGGIPNNNPDLVDQCISKLRDQGIRPTTHWIVKTPVLGCLTMAASLLDTEVKS